MLCMVNALKHSNVFVYALYGLLAPGCVILAVVVDAFAHFVVGVVWLSLIWLLELSYHVLSVVM